MQPSPTPAPSRLQTWLAPCLLVAAVLLAWSNSFSGPFVLDDVESIVSNPSLQHFWSFAWLTPPASIGETVGGRPVLNASFALNHALGGLSVTGYHGVNLLIHAAAALTLYGVLRRSFLLLGRNSAKPSLGVLADSAAWLSLTLSLLWALHPLNTAAVTYVVQRAESLSALFTLLTFYGFLRASEGPSPRLWTVVALGACLLGVGTKETVAVAPLLVLLFDRGFVAGSFRNAWQQRRFLHLGLFLCWLPLAWLVLHNHGRGGSAGLGSSVDSWTYLLTQAEAIVHYLRLAIWPDSLVFDYGMPLVSSLGDVILQVLLLGSALGVCIWGLIKNQAWAFAGTATFLLLAPSSSIIPVATQTMAEHRFYLPLAVLMVLVGAPLWSLLAQRGQGPRVAACGTALALSLGLGLLTFERNQVYSSELSLWKDTVAKRPDSARARNNLGLSLAAAKRHNEAIEQFRKAIALNPKHAFAHFNLGVALLQSNPASEANRAEAEQAYQRAIEVYPQFVDARINLGKLLSGNRRFDEAIAQYQSALSLDPSAQDARVNLAALQLSLGRNDEALTLLRQALEAQPTFAEAHYQFGLALERRGSIAEAESAFRECLRLKPAYAPAQLAIGNLLLRRNHPGAEACFREAIRLDPSFAEAWFSLGNALIRQNRFADAQSCYRETLRFAPGHLQALANLGNCQLVSGQIKDAIATYEEVLRRQPTNASVRENLAYAREMLRQGGTLR